MAGRRPLPTAIKKLAGNPGRRPLNEAELQPDTGAPEKPKGMHPGASREWDRVVPMLLKLGVLTRVDGKGLMAYCDAYAIMEEARKDYRKHGLMIDTPVFGKDGEPLMDSDGDMVFVHKKNPSFEIWNAAAKTMAKFLIEFGLTPAARAKLKISPPKEADPFADFLKDGGQAAVAQVKEAAVEAFDTGVPPAPETGVPDIAANAMDFN